MTVATRRLETAATMRGGLGTPVNKPPPLIVPGWIRRATVIVGDLLGATALVLSIPFVILAIGMPIALGVRLLFWMIGML